MFYNLRNMLLIFFLIWFTQTTYAFSISFPGGTNNLYSIGASLTATVEGFGTVGAETPFLMQSKNYGSISGSKTIDLGVINNPGFYSLVIYVGTDKPKFYSVLVLPAAQKNYQIRIEEIQSIEIDKSFLGTLDRFREGLTDVDRLKKVISLNYKNYIGSSIVDIGTVGITCTVTVFATPSGGAGFAPMCFSSLADLGLELGTSFLLDMIRSMHDDGVLNQSEAQKLLGLVTLTKIASNFIDVTDIGKIKTANICTAMASLSDLNSITTNNQGAQLISRYLGDSLARVEVLLSMNKNNLLKFCGAK